MGNYIWKQPKPNQKLLDELLDSGLKCSRTPSPEEPPITRRNTAPALIVNIPMVHQPRELWEDRLSPVDEEELIDIKKALLLEEGQFLEEDHFNNKKKKKRRKKNKR